MSYFIEAQRLVDQLDFKKAKEILEKVVEDNNENIIESYELLLEISQENSSAINQIEKKYIDYLYRNKHFSLLYKKLNEKIKNSENLQQHFGVIFIDILWQLGRVAEYESYLLMINKLLIKNKLHSRLDDLYKLYLSKNFVIEKIEFLRLEYFVLINDIFGILNIIKKIEDKYQFSHDSNTNIHRFLERVKVSDYKIYHLRLKYKILLGYSLTNKEKIEFLILSNEETELLILLDYERDESNRKELVKALVQKYKFRASSLPKKYKKLSKCFVKNNSQIKIFERDEDNELESFIKDFKFGSSQEVKGIKRKCTLTLEEEELLQQIKNENIEYKRLNDYIVSFLSMDMNYVAKYLINKLQLTSHKCYLMCEVNKRILDMVEIVYWANKGLSLKSTTNEKKLNFLKFKLFAYENTDPAKSKSVYREIVKYDPSFENARGKLLK